ncbi:MAG: rhodanese-like domain-containing protein, partial [Arcobacteraceae bacterium]|nr:rhodanese-like domain-containing protein [Arcobacteraceae bacterium]
ADITAIEAYKMQQNGVILVDTRTKKEYDFMHPKGAILIESYFEKDGQRVFNDDFVTQVEDLVSMNLSKEIVLICRSGSRSKKVATILAENGFSNIYNVKTGFVYDWIKEKLPIEK